MATYNLFLKMVTELSVRNNVTEDQIRNFLANIEPRLKARLTALVNQAPQAASATLENTNFRLKIHKVGPGLWSIYPKLVLTITVADGITQTQVRSYLEGYWNQAKVDLRGLVGDAPRRNNVQILKWHVHRLSGDTDEAES